LSAGIANAAFLKGRREYSRRTPTVRRRVAAIVVLAVLAACAQAPTSHPSSETKLALRNPTAPLGGTSRFDAARFAGQWQTLACIGTCASQVIYSSAAKRSLTRITPAGQAAYLVASPGVLRGANTLVVMWIDEGFRTAVVGDADGSWAAILDRRRPGGADRIKAARDILDFNGWDISKLKEING
jgi:apolipoprotein D and lipocalin family protein